MGRVVLGKSELRGPSFNLRCGKCIGCMSDRAQSWALRIVHEAQCHTKFVNGASVSNSCFVTLTYDDDHLPADLSVSVREWQLFAKRLRKAIGPFRFFASGEYGDRNWRPHYHACLFGVDFSSDKLLLERSPKGDLFTSHKLSSVWQRGFVTVGSLEFGSAAYVARYCLKKVGREVHTERYRRVDDETGEVWSVAPEFAVMSRRPGVGSEWFERFGREVFPVDSVVHEGRQYKPPRFYLDRLDDVAADSVKERRFLEALKHGEDSTPRRLEDREECARRASQRVRGL